MNQVPSLDFYRAAREKAARAERQASGGGPPYDGDMEARVAKLEALAEKTGERLTAIDLRLTRIEAKQEEFTKHYATKADLTEAKNSIIVWVVGAIFLAQLVPTLPAMLRAFGWLK